MLTRFAQILTQNVLLLREADANKIAITPVGVGRRSSAATRPSSTRSEVRDGAARASDLTRLVDRASADRQKVAGLKVERYFDQLIAGKTRLRPLPSALATLLRERLPYTIHDAGVNRAVELATEQKEQGGLGRAARVRCSGRPGRPPVPGQAPGAQPAPPAEASPPARASGEAVMRVDRNRGRGLVLLGLLRRGRGRIGGAAQDSTAVAPPDAQPPRHYAAPTGGRAGATARRRPGLDRRGGPGASRWWATARCSPRRWTRRSSRGSRRGSRCRPIPTRSTRSGSRSSPRSSTRSCWSSRRSATPAIKVTDQEIADGVEQQVRKVRGNFSSEVDYKNELKKAGFRTPEEYRRWLTDQQRRAAFQNRLIDKLRRTASSSRCRRPSRRCGRTSTSRRADLGNRPATISFRQIVIAPKPIAGGQGAHAGPGGLDRARAAAGRRLRHRRQAVLAGSRVEGPGRLAQLVPARA